MTSTRFTVQALAAAAITALAIAAAPAWAQTAAPAAPAGPKATGDTKASDAAFAKVDKNADGKVTKDEVEKMPGIASKFDMLDADKDGALSKAEFAAAPKE
jgi:EF hand